MAPVTLRGKSDMSIQHLHALREALQNGGWTLHLVDDEPANDNSAFRLHDEMVTWTMCRRDFEFVDLVFHAFDHLGRRTDDLSDLLYCVEPSSGATLNFGKIGSPAWRSDLIGFVQRLVPSRTL